MYSDQRALDRLGSPVSGDAILVDWGPTLCTRTCVADTIALSHIFLLCLGGDGRAYWLTSCRY